MDSLDAFIYREVWAYCLAKCRGRAKRAYKQYTLLRSTRQVGTFQLGLLVGDQVVRLPRLSNIPRKRLTLSYPPPVYRMQGRDWLAFIATTCGALFMGGEVFGIDSLPVPVCRRVRARRCRKGRGRVYWGGCAAKREKFFGWRLHLLCTPAAFP
jgi:hypothetical protein